MVRSRLEDEERWLPVMLLKSVANGFWSTNLSSANDAVAVWIVSSGLIQVSPVRASWTVIPIGAWPRKLPQQIEAVNALTKC